MADMMMISDDEIWDLGIWGSGDLEEITDIQQFRLEMKMTDIKPGRERGHAACYL